MYYDEFLTLLNKVYNNEINYRDFAYQINDNFSPAKNPSNVSRGRAVHAFYNILKESIFIIKNDYADYKLRMKKLDKKLTNEDENDWYKVKLKDSIVSFYEIIELDSIPVKNIVSNFDIVVDKYYNALNTVAKLYLSIDKEANDDPSIIYNNKTKYRFLYTLLYSFSSDNNELEEYLIKAFYMK